MVIVDAHCHASLDWYEPIETLLFEMDRYGVDQAVLIQINGQFDNSYQAEAVRRYPRRFCSVVLVDPLQPDAPKTLERLAEEGASGVRLGPRVRSPGEDPLVLWRTAARLGLAISCGGSSGEFAEPEFADIVQALPEARIVLEHLGGLSRPDDNARRSCVFELARFPNVFIKVTGLGEFATRAMPVRTPFPFEEPVPDYLEQAYQQFGPARMMWGSDFPPVAAREGYGRALRGCQQQFTARSAADQELILGGTARSVFPIHG